MPTLPQRQSLVTQLTAIMRREIAHGTWRDWLPNERTLSETLQVSRNTLRTALVELQREGVIRAMHGSGNRILGAPKTETPDPPIGNDIAILSPEPIERLRPNFTLWINQLRVLGEAKRYRLHLLHGRQYFRANPGPALHKLLRQQPHACWILILAGKSTQRWFDSNRVPCVVAGTVHVGIQLPYCAQDHRLMAFDAAKRFFALGHRKIALLTRRGDLAVDLASEDGFKKASPSSARPKREAIIARHDDTVAGVCQQVRQLMRQNPAPTGLLVTNAHYHLTVSGCLQQLGKRVPQDVSLISRTDDPFLEYLAPSPARYAARPREMAEGLLKLIAPLLTRQKRSRRSVQIPPRFINGESLGPAPEYRGRRESDGEPRTPARP
jgi:LacI family transcriptional regulator